MSTVSLKISRKRIRMHRPSFSRVMLYIFLCLMVVVCALPLFAMVCRALMPLDELYLYPPRLIVQKPTLRNFSDLLTSLSSSTVPFTRYIFNSLFTTVATVLASILVCCLGAYGLVKHRPAGSNIIFGIVVAALSFSTHVTTIPNYLVVNKLGLVNTCWALIIPKIAVAYNFFLVKQFCEQLPDSILEAARIDGLSEYGIWAKIMLPLSTAAIATLVIFTFVGTWNDYMGPMIYLTRDENKTIQVGLRRFIQEYTSDYHLIMAASLVSLLPVSVVFLCLQKYFIEGIATSGLKG
jgi:ABC-type glycerol-3-phosphate transport system permease component